MSEERHSTVSSAEAAPCAGPAALPSAGRRRALLRGLGKAGAIAGSALPLASLATGDKPGMRLMRDGKAYQCSASGALSVMHSAQLNIQTTCGGKPVSYYKDMNNWPGGATNPVCPVGLTNFLATASFATVFDGTWLSGSSGFFIRDLVVGAPTSQEAHWITAMLNATKMAPSFPHTTLEVRALCKAGGKSAADALAFYSTYLEQG